MAITAEQRKLRKQFIGSSDAAAVCGVDPYRTAGDVYLEKTGQADGFEGNANTERGNLLEPVLLTWAEQKLGKMLLRDKMCVDASGLLCANFDALVEPMSDGASVEAKTATNSDEWGEEGTDEIPERHIVQAHHGFAVRPVLRVCYLPVLLPSYRSLDFRMYVVERNDGLADAIGAQCRQFMEHHVRLGIPPQDFRPSLEVLKRVRRQPEKTVEIPDDVVDHLIIARAAKKQAEDDYKTAEAALLTKLADAEAGTYSRGVVTYMEQKRKGYTVADCAFRTLRVKPAKGSGK